MQSFSQKTKEALCSTDTGKLCCCLSEISGILLFSGKLKSNELRITSESQCVSERLRYLINKCFGVELLQEQQKSGSGFVISDTSLLRKIYDKTQIGGGIKIPDSVMNRDCCRASFLKGAFLGGGTVIDPNKNYSMEFLTPSKELSCDFEKLLKDMGLDFKVSVRKGNFVVYAKNSDVICDALTHMGAFSAQMEMLNVKIEREIRNDLNRAANGETANMDKVIVASSRQIRAISIIDEKMGIDNLPEELREIAYIRRDNKDLSLDALGRLLVPPLSKSGVNHRLKKIIDIAEGL